MPADNATTWLSWSSGKDSAWCLHVLRQRTDVTVVGLVTTVNREARRVAIHGVRETLVQAQADALGLPLIAVPLPQPCSNKEYEAAMEGVWARGCEEGVTHIAFGDLFLEDIRRYRETQLRSTGLTPMFPIWGLDTKGLSDRMVADGLQAVVTCVDSRRLDPSFAGRVFDRSFLDDLPDGVDPCGERGEFHTLAFAGPIFRQALPIIVGERVERDGFVFADVQLREAS